MASDNGSGRVPPHFGLIGGGKAIPIIGGADNSRSRLASVDWIQVQVVARCTCGGTIIFVAYTSPGKCGACKAEFLINRFAFDRDKDPEAMDLQVGRYFPPRDEGADDGVTP